MSPQFFLYYFTSNNAFTNSHFYWFRSCIMLIVVCLLGIAFQVNAQYGTEPHPLNKFLTDILNFDSPTGIRGTLRHFDMERGTIWLNWEERSTDRPLFETGWEVVPGKPALEVYPRDLDQFKKILRISKDITIQMIIQFDQERRRRILWYQDPFSPPQFPL